MTFPFLFGVMFGDIGHGTLLFLFSAVLCMLNGQLKHIEALEPVLSMRYTLLLMGFFAAYMGLLYNDFLSMPLELFGKSCYTADIW